jgi:formate dehydrogenase iron-sulfur subunit
MVELAFGVTLKELMYDICGGTMTGKPLRAVQVGGPLGAYMPESQWDTPIDYESFSAIGAVLGHGGVVMFDETVDMGEQARFSMEFCTVESCGKCTPCRIGSTRGVEVIDRIRSDDNVEKNWTLLEDLCETMLDGSLCAMGGMTPFPVQSAMKYFAEDFTASKANS